jgi:hypothetical protein
LNTTKSQELGEKLIVVTNLRHQGVAEEARGGDEVAAKYVGVSKSEAEQADCADRHSFYTRGQCAWRMHTSIMTSLGSKEGLSPFVKRTNEVMKS